MRKALWPAVVLIALLLPTSALGLGPGVVEGTVTAPGPVGEVEVCAVEAEPSEACTYPLADGTFRLSGLSLGSQRIEFSPSSRSHYLRQYYDGKSSLAEAATISLTPTMPTAAGVDAHLELGGVIEGRVTAVPGGDPLAGVEACAMNAGTKAVASCAETDGNGEYAIRGLGRDSYKVGFWGEGPSAAYMPRFYLDAPSFALGGSVAVLPGATRGGIDAQLSEGARVVGTVTDAYSGRALPGIAVCLLEAGEVGLDRCAATGERGEYELPGIESGSYEVVFSPEFSEFAPESPVLLEDDGYGTRYYDEASSRGGATPVSLIAPAPSTGIDARLTTSHAGLSPAPAIALPVPSIAAPAIFTDTPAKKKAKRCGRDYRKGMVRGQVRCIKIHRRKGKRGGKKGMSP